MHLRGSIAVSVACAVFALIPISGCAGGEEVTDGVPTTDSGDGDTGGGGGEASVDTGGAEDTGAGDTGASDTGASDTGSPALTGKTVTAGVAGGTSMQSATYRLITTTGQVPGSSTLSSSSYQLKGGVVSISQP